MNLNDHLPDNKTGAAMTSSDPFEIILVATIGTSPAVLMETVLALAHRSPPVIIDRVVVITTLRGRSELQ